MSSLTYEILIHNFFELLLNFSALNNNAKELLL